MLLDDKEEQDAEVQINWGFGTQHEVSPCTGAAMNRDGRFHRAKERVEALGGLYADLAARLVDG